MNSYTERMVMAGPRHYHEVLQEAMTDISKKLNDFLKAPMKSTSLFMQQLFTLLPRLCAPNSTNEG